jgi:hypothetical protein
MNALQRRIDYYTINNFFQFSLNNHQSLVYTYQTSRFIPDYVIPTNSTGSIQSIILSMESPLRSVLRVRVCLSVSED